MERNAVGLKGALMRNRSFSLWCSRRPTFVHGVRLEPNRSIVSNSASVSHCSCCQVSLERRQFAKCDDSCTQLQVGHSLPN